MHGWEGNSVKRNQIINCHVTVLCPITHQETLLLYVKKKKKNTNTNTKTTFKKVVVFLVEQQGGHRRMDDGVLICVEAGCAAAL